MTPPLHVIDRGSTAVVRGNAYAHLTAAGIRPYYVGGDACGFVLDAHRLPDFLAHLDAHRVPYRLREVAA